ncbi:MAG: riboflavin synthase [Coraliomargarita sp. TMED73]|jgi:riboflavin synthase|nr:MAG: riboflavin synthase [Coraliomargarita sp. TMED73]|tara:strand:+ start:1443 stop:2060 length:618 start_codon:yes stop_codon:yes gene_type:complete
MFTGIVEETGIVRSFTEQEQAWRLVLDAAVVTKGLQLGDSVAVNGCCLTVVDFAEDRLEFDLLAQSVRLTSIDGIGPGGRVNLERALLPTTRMGGHFVSGHVDGTGAIATIEPRGKDVYLRITPDPEMLRYVVAKGCVAVDGISLTVAELDDTGFSIWLIPHTLEVTNLGDKRAGDRVNLEFDLLAKYVERLLGKDDDSSLTWIG